MRAAGLTEDIAFIETISGDDCEVGGSENERESCRGQGKASKQVGCDSSRQLGSWQVVGR